MPKPLETAEKIEEAVYQYLLKRVEEEGMVFDWEEVKIRKMYRDKMVSICYNLAKTKSFMKRLKSGDIKPEQIPTMTPQDVAPEVWQEIISRRQHEEELIETVSGAILTTMEECGKCGHNVCEVYSLQTRSVDEGTTNFYTCTKCGNKWKQ